MEIQRYEIKQRMSKVVIHNQTAYLCGQTGAGDTIQEQTVDMLNKVDTLLKEIGSSKDKILTATIYLSDMVNFAGMNEVWDNWVEEGKPPARACVEAKMCREPILVEISVIAAV